MTGSVCCLWDRAYCTVTKEFRIPVRIIFKLSPTDYSIPRLALVVDVLNTSFLLFLSHFDPTCPEDLEPLDFPPSSRSVPPIPPHHPPHPPQHLPHPEMTVVIFLLDTSPSMARPLRLKSMRKVKRKNDTAYSGAPDDVRDFSMRSETSSTSSQSSMAYVHYRRLLCPK